LEATSLRLSLGAVLLDVLLGAPSAVGMGAGGTDVSAGTRRSRSGLGVNPSLTFRVRISEGAGAVSGSLGGVVVDWAFSNLTNLTLSAVFPVCEVGVLVEETGSWLLGSAGDGVEAAFG
jgi:hypothetical protein